MKKIHLILVLLLAFAVLACTSGVASAFLIPKYVGNTIVDLEWTPYENSTDFSKYELCRNESTNITTITDRLTTFYRDTGLPKGIKYNYKLRCYNATGKLMQTAGMSATTGEVHGTITQDTTWTAASSPYTLTKYVQVFNGTTLTIESGVKVINYATRVGGFEGQKGVLYANNSSFYDCGITVYDEAHAEIKNCSFEDKSINILNSSYNTLTGNTVYNSGAGIYLGSSSHNTLTDNTVSNTSGYGIKLYFSGYNTISGNTVYNNTYNGIWLSSSSDNTLTGNTCNENLDGIVLHSSSNNVITGNTASNNSGTGIYLGSSSDNTLTGNTCNENLDGIVLDSSSNNMLTDNTASNNSGRHGISLGSSNNNVITGNTVSNNNNWYGTSGIGLSSSNNNVITGNTVSNNNNWYGIKLSCSSSNNVISDNTVSNNGDGIGCLSSNNVISDNTVSNNDDRGIYLVSSNNSIMDNTVSNTSGYGIKLYFSGYNTISGNTVYNNSLKGIYLDSSKNNVITGNTASNNSRYGISLGSSDYNTLTGNICNENLADGIDLYYSSDYNTLTDNTAYNNAQSGILLWKSSNNTLTDNTAYNNTYKGIVLSSSSNNVITGNTASNNSGCGIYLVSSSDYNTIYNNYFNNTYNAYDSGNNTWNIAKTSGTNIVGGPYLGGNYWSDYEGEDLDGDKLGDTLLPYNSFGRIENGGDYHPLIIIPKIILKASKDGYASVQHAISNDENFERIEISGKVTDKSTGESIEGARIEIVKGANSASTTTDVDGTYTITAIIPEGSESDTREDINFELTPSQYIVGVYEITTEVIEFIEENNGTIIDQCQYENGPRALLVYISEEENINDFINNVGSSPAVKYIELIQVRSKQQQQGIPDIIIKASRDGYAEEFWRVGNSQNFGSIDMSGKVTDRSTGEAIESAKVEIIVGADSASTTTKPDGTYSITAFCPGGSGSTGVDKVNFQLTLSLYMAPYVPNDPRYAEQWGPQNVDTDIAWNVEKGAKTIRIAIVDDGIDYYHEDLAGNYLTGGADWGDKDTDPYPTPEGADHGTFCAGIAAAVMDNNKGIAGTAQCQLWAERVYNSTDICTDWMSGQGIMHAAHQGADIISMSYGGEKASKWETEAVDYAWRSGCILVAASGNEADEFTYNIAGAISYPAAHPQVIAVGATNQNNARASFSNWGPELELVAPGVDILSTVPNNGYESGWDGTSMATPRVAGVAALVWSWSQKVAAVDARYKLTNQQVRAILQQTADDLGPPGQDVKYGYGKVNAAVALRCVNIRGKVAEIGLNDPIPSAAVSAALIGEPSGTFSTLKSKYGSLDITTGDYWIRVLPGTYKVCAMAYGYIPNTGYEGDHVELPALDSSVMNFELMPFFCTASGNVTDSLTGLPISEASVVVEGPPPVLSDKDFHLEINTDTDGNYSFILEYSVHRQGIYNVTVSMHDYQTQAKDFTLSWGEVCTDYYKCPLDPRDYNPPRVNFSLLCQLSQT